jgi:alkanesulfonate monooxygenase SsuD/methylene tetrahydromethanopterin reductase-like flavin-dependent oxidoreductase (luciferase family)
MATTLDHASHGRAVLGIGAGWFGREHTAFGLPFPSAGERLDRLEESAGALRRLLAGETVSVEGTWVQLDRARLDPLGVQRPLPMMIGGSGPKRTLPIVAQYADIWNGEGSPSEYAERMGRLDELCRVNGRDPHALERTVGLAPPLIRSSHAAAVAASIDILRSHGMPEEVARAQVEAAPTVGTVEQVAGALASYQRAGAQGVIFDWPPPFDDETLVALAGEVRQAAAEAYAAGT